MSADSSPARQASATQPLLQVPGTPPAGQRPSSNLPKRATQGHRAPRFAAHSDHDPTTGASGAGTSGGTSGEEQPFAPHCAHSNLDEI
jgi:hypothetical protein